jgi:DNA repair exonuclease SbcCD ATPase subunit
MATNIEEILGKSINSVKELKEEIKRLQDALVQTDSDSEEWKSTTEKLVSAQKLLTDVTKAGKQAVEANATSIAGLEKEYKSLYNAYRLLSEEERKSPFGKEMASSLEELSNKLNETKKEVGNFKDNIGRYSESAIDAFSKMGISIGGITQPIGQAKAAMGLLNKTMLANPVMWLLAGLKLLVEIFQRVGEAIKGNEESQMKLNVAMANFQPIIDAISNAFDWLGQKVVDLISFIGTLYSKWEVFRAGVSDLIGLTDNEKGKVQEQQRAYNDLAESKNNLIKQKRENLKLNATQEAELETLKNEAAATNDIAVKLEKLNKAKQLEEEITQRKIKEKEEELRLLNLEASFTANDTAMNDKIALAEAELSALRAEGARRTKELTTQIQSLTNAQNNNTQAQNNNTQAQKDANKAIEEAKRLREEELKAIVEIQDRFKTEEQLLTEKYEAEKKLLEKYNQDTEKLTEEHNKKIAELRAEETEKARRDSINQRERSDADAYITKALELMNWDNINEVSHNKYYEKVNALRLEQYLLRQEQIYDELELENLTLDEKLKLYQEYYANLNALREEYRRADEAVYESKMNNVGSILNMIDAVGQLSNAISQNIELDIESGKISKQEAEKKKKQLKSLQAVQLAVSIATIAGDTAMGITSLWTAFAKKKVANTQLINPVAIASANALDLATTIAQTATMATMAGAQMAAAIGGYVSQVNSISQMGSESNTTPNTTPQNIIDSSSYTYTRELQTEQEKEDSRKSIVVYVDDIKRALDNRDKVNVETSF